MHKHRITQVLAVLTAALAFAAPSFAQTKCEDPKVLKFSLMPRPAASSPAVLMRIPDDSRPMLADREVWVAAMLR